MLARIFTADGLATSDTFPLSPETCWGVSSPSLGSSGGYGAVVWESTLDHGLMLRRFSGEAPWRDVPLVSGGRRFADMATARRRILIDSDAEHSVREAAARFLFCLRGSARNALGDLRRCASGGLPTAPQSACIFGVASVAESSEEGLPTLLEVLNNHEQSDRARSAAACAMGLFGQDGSSAAGALESALEEDSGQLVGCAGKSLGKIGEDGSVPALAAALLGRNWEPTSLEVHRMLMSGLLEFPDDPLVEWVLTRYWRACNWRDAYLKDSGRTLLDSTDRLEVFVKNFLRRYEVDDTRRVYYTIGEAQRRLEEGWVDFDGYHYHGRSRPEHDQIDIIVTQFVAIRNLGQVSLCDGAVALADALAGLDDLPKWAVSLFKQLFWQDGTAPCLTDLLTIAEDMGPKGAPLAETIVQFVGPDDAPRIDAIRALAATDPGCERCLPALRRLLSVEDRLVKLEVIRALIAAGPNVIWQFRSDLTEMLRDTSPDLRRYAEMALDLMEIDTEACNTTWDPIDNPDLEPTLTAQPDARPLPPPGSPRPPRPIRSPVGSYTGEPKKPD